MEHELTKYRNELGLTMDAFGSLVGASKSMISKWEAGIALPRRRYLEKMYEVTGGRIQPGHFVGIPGIAAEAGR